MNKADLLYKGFSDAILSSLWYGIILYGLTKFIILRVKPKTKSKQFLLLVCFTLISIFFFRDLLNLFFDAVYHTNAGRESAKSTINFLSPGEVAIPGLHSVCTKIIYYAYVTGLCLFSAKTATGYFHAHRLKQSRHLLPVELLDSRSLLQLVSLFAEKYRVRIALSNLIDVPCTVGFVKKIILLPLSLTSCLTSDELELILLHEYQHIKQYDYLVNVYQTVVETVLFFNPIIHLISGEIRKQREILCDETVIKTKARPVLYVETLIKIQELRLRNKKFVLSLVSDEGELLQRVSKILSMSNPKSNNMKATIATFFTTAVMAGFGFALQGQEVNKNGNRQMIAADTPSVVVNANNYQIKILAAKPAENAKTLLPKSLHDKRIFYSVKNTGGSWTAPVRYERLPHTAKIFLENKSREAATNTTGTDDNTATSSSLPSQDDELSTAKERLAKAKANLEKVKAEHPDAEKNSDGSLGTITQKGHSMSDGQNEIVRDGAIHAANGKTTISPNQQ